MLERLRKSLKTEEGATMVEYALMVALVAIALIVVIRFMTGEVSNTFQDVGEQLQDARD